MIPIINESIRHTDRYQWAKQNQHICLLPYTSYQYFHRTDSVSPCCNLERTVNTDYFIHIKELKKSTESGQLYKNCHDCYKCEAENKVSERMRHLIGLSEETLDSLLTTQHSDHFYIHCTLSSLCNMACRSCNPNTSSLYKKIIFGDNKPSSTISDNPDFWQALLNSIKEVVAKYELVTVVISGGEGFVQPDFLKLTQWLIENKISQNIRIAINTNGSIIDEKIYELLCTNFKEVNLAVSVDSIHENYHYVRWPYHWDKIESNLLQFLEYQKKYSNFSFFLTPVWGINNIFYLKDWVEYFEKFNDGRTMAYDTPLYQPSWMDVQYLPGYLKQELIADLEYVLSSTWMQKNVAFHANIKNLLEHCKNQIDSPAQQREWKNYVMNTTMWDTKTKTKLSVHCRKLYEKLNDTENLI